MLATMLAGVMMGAVARQGACAGGGSLESGVCEELQRGVRSSLELLQHGKQRRGKVDRTGRRHIGGKSMEPEHALDVAAEQDAPPEAEKEAQEKYIQQLANHVIRTDPNWTKAKEELSRKAIAKARHLIIGRVKQEASQMERAPVSRYHRSGRRALDEAEQAWQAAKQELLQQAGSAIEAALRVPKDRLNVEALDPMPKRMPEKQATEEAMQGAMGAEPGPDWPQVVNTDTVTDGVAERSMAFANLSIAADVAQQKAMDELEHKILESFAARALLIRDTEILKNVTERTERTTRMAWRLAEQRAGAVAAWQRAKREAAERRLDKISLDVALETYRWKQTQNATAEAVPDAREDAWEALKQEGLK